jgi:hypothetical protein
VAARHGGDTDTQRGITVAPTEANLGQSPTSVESCWANKLGRRTLASVSGARYKKAAPACDYIVLSCARRFRVTTRKSQLSCDRVFTWRRLDSSFHPICRDDTEEDGAGNLTLALPVFRLMRAPQSAVREHNVRFARALLLLLRTCWRRIREFIVHHLQGGPYLLLVCAVPDLLSDLLWHSRRDEAWRLSAPYENSALSKRAASSSRTS